MLNNLLRYIRKSVREHWFLLIVLLPAAIIRIKVINRSFVYDEAFSADKYFTSNLASIFNGDYLPNNHLLYSFLANLCHRLLGASDYVFRLPALAFGLASIILVYVICRKLISRSTAIFASVLIGFSLVHIRFATEARGYSALMCLAVLAFYLALTALRTGKIKHWGLLALSLSLASGFHLYNVIIYPGLLVIFVIYLLDDLHRNKYSISLTIINQTVKFLLCVTVSLAMTIYLYRSQVDLMGYFMSKIFSGRYPGPLFQVVQPLPFDFHYLTALFGFLFFGPGSILNYIALFFLALGLADLRRDRTRFLYLLAFVVAPLLAAWAFRLTYYYRFFFFLSPFLMIIVADGLVFAVQLVEKLVAAPNEKYVVWSFAFFLGFIIAPKTKLEPIDLYYENKIDSESRYFDTRSLADYLRENLNENDVILSCTHFSVNTDYQIILRYYLDDLYDKHQLKQILTRENGQIDLWMLSDRIVRSAIDIKRPLLVPARVNFRQVESFPGWYVYKSPFVVTDYTRNDAPSRVIAFRNFLQAFYDQRNKQYEKAVKNYQLFLRANAQQEAAYNNMALIAVETDDDEQALDLLEKTVKNNPNLSLAWLNLGLIEHKIGIKKQDGNLLAEARKTILDKIDQVDDQLTAREMKSIVMSKKRLIDYPWQVATLDWLAAPGRDRVP